MEITVQSTDGRGKEVDIDLSLYVDHDDFLAGVKEELTTAGAKPDTGYAIVINDDQPPVPNNFIVGDELDEEYWDFIEDTEKRNLEACCVFLGWQGTWDPQRFDDAYRGEFDDIASFAQTVTEDIEGQLPDWVVIDWEKTGEGMMQDYFEEDGYYFRNI